MDERKAGWKYFTEKGSGRGSAWMVGGVQVFLERREAEGIRMEGWRRTGEGLRVGLETALRRDGE
jgi:hypothetical protein